MKRKPAKLRAKLKDGITVVKALISHPMETGLRKNKQTGEPIPSHFIQGITCSHNGELKVSMGMGISVSANPFLQFELEGGATGDTLELTWKDNLGESGTATTRIK